MNELADLKKRISAMEETLAIRKALYDDMRVTIVCILSAIQKVQTKFGLSFMRKGEFYGLKF